MSARLQAMAIAMAAASGAAASEGGRADDAPLNASVPGLVADVRALEARYPMMALCHWGEDETAFVYADWLGVLRHIVSDAEGPHENWNSGPLESPVRELLTADLDRDGYQEIVALTADSRLYVWTMLGYELRWDSTGESVGEIQAITIADIDSDPALEIVLCVDRRIAIYDGIELFREKTGRDEIDPIGLAVADVDGDGATEIVTSDGHVIDSTSLIIEWSTEPFGYPLQLFDLDGDGVPEVVGQSRGGLKFWDIAERRERW